MSASRAVFSLPLYASYQFLIVLGYAFKPSRYRPLLFIPIALIAIYLVFFTTTGTIADVGLGGAIMTHLAHAFDAIVLKDVQKVWYRVGEKPGGISSAGFKSRLAWAWHLHNSPRGVGWYHAKPHIPRNPPSYNSPQDRKAFVISRLYTLSICVVVQAGFYFINAANPALAPGATPLTHQSLYIRALSTLGQVAPALATMTAQHCALGIVLVTVGISQPADWPPLFGSPKNMYTVSAFWRDVWHQMMRNPITSIASFIVHSILRIPHISPKSSPRTQVLVRLLKLHLAFLVSALIHASGEFMMLGYGCRGAFTFFILQPWAITLELGIQYLLTGSIPGKNNNKLPTLIWRMVGYVWVLVWFITICPLIQQPMVEAGLFLGTPGSVLTQKVGRLLALDTI
ncbi:hypothetical protein Agabi119p4_5312 [Agaricus bisporus var. burnettii]|uniref:Wax synthase domain-containing protein n=1 Tax=Agaricus bisporus var. burnettii TaxID=192524 RepID=A0A8H7F1C8_AGABI|nr:hypothetical protein Agabi119p4_5312 [Agaricus bisporus var. burnettii]